jgi:hypothetical protein
MSYKKEVAFEANLPMKRAREDSNFKPSDP